MDLERIWERTGSLGRGVQRGRSREKRSGSYSGTGTGEFRHSFGKWRVCSRGGWKYSPGDMSGKYFDVFYSERVDFLKKTKTSFDTSDRIFERG